MKPRPLLAAYSLALAIASGSLSSAARGQTPQYVVTDLGTLGGTFSAAASINDSGQITGDASTSAQVLHAFLYSGGVMSDLDTLGNAFSVGFSINNSGEVVGDASSSFPPNSTFGIVASAGSMSVFGTTSEARGINTAGQVAGTSGGLAYLYTAGTYKSLGSLATFGGTSSGLGLNNLGQVVGSSSITNNPNTQHAFLYSGGKMTDLMPLNFFGTSEALAINDSGQVTGAMAGNAFLYSGGQFTNLGTLGGDMSEGEGMNNAGQVVGNSQIAGNAAQHAILFSNGTLYDLNSLVTNLASTDFTYLDFAQDINNSGVIVGRGITATGVAHAFEAQLVPEPGSATLLVLGAGAILGWRWRRTSI